MRKNNTDRFELLSGLASHASRRKFIKASAVILASYPLLAIPCASVFQEQVSSRQIGNRLVALMIESSGLKIEDGHRVIEVSAVELIDQKFTGRNFHQFLDPERDICPGAEAVHGLTRDYLTGMPKFTEIADSLLGFVAGSELISVNSNFHARFIDSELARINRPALSSVCTTEKEILSMARQRYPGQLNDLDSLLVRLEIDPTELASPEKASCVAAVYLAMQNRLQQLTISKG